MAQKARLWCMAGLAASLALVIWLFLVVGAEGSPLPSAAWTRILEPVILSGDQLPQFDGVAGDDLFAYAYRNGTWQQIPLQLDEVDATGAYTTENGLLDANDELVFMAMDLGEQASPSAWIADADAQSYTRYEIQVSDPLNPAEQGWVYVYRSATVAPAFADYVSWDAGNNQIVAGAYTAGFNPAVHPGVDSLELNGSGVDVLDRSKIRVQATCHIGPIPIGWTFTEETLPIQADVTPNVDGPVRVGGGTTASSSWSYYAIYQIQAGMDLSSFQPPDSCTSIDINSVRLSVDWLDPASSGMAPATYYDDNTPAGVAIDGSPDSVASSPADTWKQVSGGWGSVVQVADISLGGGTVTNYYKDDQAVDTNDTGDQRSFGDAGFRVDNPAGQVQFELTTFVLGAGQPNVGATYRDYQAHPLQATAVAQAYEPPCAPTGVKFDWSPHPVYVGVTDTFNASVSAGQPPFTYTWTFGDDGSTATGNPVTHTFDLSGTFPVSLTVSNACSTTLPVVRPILVSEPGSAYLVCLPLVVRAFP